MNWIEHERAQREAERHQDMSRSAFILGVIALAVVAAFAFVMLLPEGMASWPR